MKITLEFDSVSEHDEYIRKFVPKPVREFHSFVPDSVNKVTIPDITRRKNFSEYELDFIKSNYMSKKNIWIAKALRRKPSAINNILYQLYKNGLPRKFPKNGEIS